MTTTTTLALRGVSKSFQGQRVLHDVDLELHAGEVHALLGQNGSGKSTLIKILAGYHEPDPGASATVNGELFELGDALAARASGIKFIHQDLGVIGDLDVVDNLALGETYSGRWWLSGRRERSSARKLLADYEVAVDVAMPLRALPAAQQTMVAIVRAIGHGIGSGGLLVLDEPTAALPNHDVDHLFDLIRRIRGRGGTVLYVTHRLPEVFEIADRVSVLRDGRRVSTDAVTDLDHDALVERIVGRPLSGFYVQSPAPRDDLVLEASGLSGGPVTDVSVTVHRGEIVGVTGLVGSGYDSLLYLIFGGGQHVRTAGTVHLEGVGELGATDPHDSIVSGLAFAPSDRKNLAALPDWTLRENLTLPMLKARSFLRWLAPGRERADAQAWLDRLRVSPPEPERMFSSLSGGNQQKAILARWLRCGAKLFLLDEPTAGVDVESKQAIYAALASLAKGGAAVLMTSSDPEELCAVCDRVLVMRNGRIAAELAGAGLTTDALAYEVIRDEALTGQTETFDRNEALHA